MSGNISDFLTHKLLDHALRATDYAEPATVYLGLYTTMPTDSGGGTEVSGNGYARQAITFGAASSRQVASNAQINFGPATPSAWGTILGWGIFDASSAGNLLAYGEFLDTPKVVTNVDTSTNLLTVTSHGWSANDEVEVEVENGTLPSPLADNTVYYVRDVLTNTLGLATTSGGSQIDITTVGNGTIWIARRYKKTVNAADYLRVDSGNCKVRLRSNLGT